MSRLTYRDVMDLPPDHPDSIRFMKEIKDLDDAYTSASQFDCTDEFDEEYDDEGTLEHFDRYVAGDRR